MSSQEARGGGAVVALEHVTKSYGGGAPAVDDLSLTIPAGEICVLVGPSGCGKTTTMKMINRLIEPTSGTITIDGEEGEGDVRPSCREDVVDMIGDVGPAEPRVAEVECQRLPREGHR